MKIEHRDDGCVRCNAREEEPTVLKDRGLFCRLGLHLHYKMTWSYFPQKFRCLRCNYRWSES